MSTLQTTDDVIDALGGTKAVAEIVSRRPQAVSNWREKVRGRFPPETYLILTAALKRRRLSAPSSLWGMSAASSQSEAA